VAGAVRTWQNRPQKQSATNARFGSRLETVERELHLEQLRRIQVEHELIRCGFVLPVWPTDPPQPAARPVVDERDLDEPESGPPTAQRAGLPSLSEQSFSRHRSRSA
jgi:hypothetical protein